MLFRSVKLEGGGRDSVGQFQGLFVAITSPKINFLICANHIKIVHSDFKRLHHEMIDLG